MEHDCQYVTKEKETDPAIAERLRKMHEMLGPLIKKELQEKKGRSEESRTETVSSLLVLTCQAFSERSDSFESVPNRSDCRDEDQTCW